MTTETTTTGASQLVTPTEAARILGVAPITLAKWRSEGTGQNIPYVKAGRFVRYCISDLVKWLSQHRCAG